MRNEGAAAELSAFSTRIGHQFHDLALLERALTHSSFHKEHNERLEFLGDAVLELVISADLYQRYPEQSEGVLTRIRARLVARSGLLLTAGAWKIAPLLRISKGERAAKGLGPRATSVIANGVEAVIGAVYVDGGYPAAERVVKNAWHNRLRNALDQPVIDAKTALQEWTQQRGIGLPSYDCEDLGVGRSPRFVSACVIGDSMFGKGSGDRKKDAEQQAATAALNALQKNHD